MIRSIPRRRTSQGWLVRHRCVGAGPAARVIFLGPRSFPVLTYICYIYSCCSCLRKTLSGHSFVLLSLGFSLPARLGCFSAARLHILPSYPSLPISRGVFLPCEAWRWCQSVDCDRLERIKPFVPPCGSYLTNSIGSLLSG